MKTKYEIRAKKFIMKFVDITKLNARNRCMMSSVIEKVQFFYDACHRSIDFRSGAVRFALISSDYVVKWDAASDYNIADYGGCEDEYEMYQVAKRDGMDYLFAEVTKFEYKGMIFYIMPRIGCADNYQKSQRNIHRLLSEGENAYLKSHVSDVHSNNWGIKDGKPIVFDYAQSFGFMF